MKMRADAPESVVEPVDALLRSIRPDLPDDTPLSVQIGGVEVYCLALGSLRAVRGAIRGQIDGSDGENTP